jgi:hypothetical protein
MVLMVLTKELSRYEIQDLSGMKDGKSFKINCIQPAIEQNYIELVYPDTPNHPQQKYRLTEKGRNFITTNNDTLSCHSSNIG